jgi:phosphatidylserine/phosphatidylglycerophosphate/cardiolipin synthase-like enzyme
VKNTGLSVLLAGVLGLTSSAAFAQSIGLTEFYDQLGYAKAFIHPNFSEADRESVELKPASGLIWGGTLYEAPMNQWFTTDFDALQKTFGGADYLEAKEKWLDTFSWNHVRAGFEYPYATLKYWDVLPHPPVFQLSGDLAKYSVRYGSKRVPNKALYSGKYQRELDTATQSELSIGNTLELRSNHEVYDELVTQTKLAKHFILASNMFETCDETMEALNQAVEQKIKEGVKVYHIFERAFQLKYVGCYARLKKMGVQVLMSDKMIRPWGRKIYHDKFWAFDDEAALIYGQNLIDTEVESDGLNGRFRDSGVLVHGPAVHDVTMAYGQIVRQLNHGYYDRELRPIVLATRQKIAEERREGKRGDQLLAFLDSPERKDRPQGLCRIVSQGPQSQQLLITNLYASLFDHAKNTVFSAMQRAPSELKDSPVTSTILVNMMNKTQADPNFTFDLLTNNHWSSTDVPSRDYGDGDFFTTLYRLTTKAEDNVKNVESSRNYLKELAPQPNFKDWHYFQYTHQKIALVDRTWAIIGSYNLNESSATGSYEISAACADDHLIGQVEAWIIKDLMNSLPILRGAR